MDYAPYVLFLPLLLFLICRVSRLHQVVSSFFLLMEYSRIEKLYGDLMEEWRSLNDEGENAAWINVGLWCGVPGQTYTAAARALADRLFAAGGVASLPPSSLVLDVGCGLGDGLLRWASLAPPGVSFVGINITPSQVDEARRRCGGRGAFEVGDATRLARAGASVDAVLALESALHFDTRACFLNESARLLRPGGRIAIADIIMSPAGFRWRCLFTNAALARFFCIPLENCVDAAALEQQFKDAGFVDVHCESVAASTFPGLLSCYARSWERRGGWENATPRARAFHLLMNYGYRPLMLFAADYVIVSARKKGGGG
jgi:ubiquinone/menaquinone biosynthesis C-methylase UbiE